MKKKATQLNLPFTLDAAFKPETFVVHKGVEPALAKLRQAYADFCGEQNFIFVFISGDKGSGKTHLLNFFLSELQAENSELNDVHVFDDPFVGVEGDDLTSRVAEFVGTYEALKAARGLLILAAGELPETGHLLSRIAMSFPTEITIPKEEELFELVIAMLDRRGLRLPEENIKFLLERLPANLLSLANILSKIDELALATQRPINRQLLKQIVG